jgi:hypothetical protein
MRDVERLCLLPSKITMSFPKCVSCDSDLPVLSTAPPPLTVAMCHSADGMFCSMACKAISILRNHERAAHTAKLMLVHRDLLQATHCHYCDDVYPVILKGYCGSYCCKGCWRSEYEADVLREEYDENDDTSYVVCRYGTRCMACHYAPITPVQSRRHRSTDVWPMIPKKKSMNACILNRQPVYV